MTAGLRWVTAGVLDALELHMNLGSLYRVNPRHCPPELSGLDTRTAYSQSAKDAEYIQGFAFRKYLSIETITWLILNFPPYLITLGDNEFKFLGILFLK